MLGASFHNSLTLGELLNVCSPNSLTVNWNTKPHTVGVGRGSGGGVRLKKGVYVSVS